MASACYHSPCHPVRRRQETCPIVRMDSLMALVIHYLQEPLPWSQVVGLRVVKVMQFSSPYRRSGWTIFLPGSDTPFGGAPIHGLANLYFQLGKYFYGGAPIRVGWVVVVLAVRQQAKAICSSAGFVLVAWMGAAARIRASRTEIPRGLGHIRMGFVLCPWAQNGHDGFVYALVILSLVGLPYLLWRIHNARTMCC